MFKTIFLPIAAVFAAFPLGAQENTSGWSDDAIWITVSETYGLERKLLSRIFEASAVREEIRRAGVIPACRAIAEFVDLKTSGASDAYRSAIIAEVRTVVPEGKTFQERISVSPSGHRLGRLVDRVEQKRPHLFAGLYTSIEAELLPELESISTIDGEWRGPFADWNFQGRNQSIWASSCTIAGSSNPTNAKMPFDGFYREQASK